MAQPWIGLTHFQTMFKDAEFWRAFKNTLIFSFGKLLFHFPMPILMAIALNEIRQTRVKKFFQTVFTFPHFISWWCCRNPYQYVRLQRDCKPGIGSAEASGGIAPDVIESLPAVHMDIQYMEGMRLGRHYLYGGFDGH